MGIQNHTKNAMKQGVGKHAGILGRETQGARCTFRTGHAKFLHAEGLL